jgi:hypothetical protein
MAKGQGSKDTPLSVEQPICGIIMPISAIGTYSDNHWNEVLSLMKRAIANAGYVPKPVWENGSFDIIQERIVNNLYNDPIAVCDVSGRNANVMLELGMRLSFGKPTIVVTDDIQSVPFDVTAMHVLLYPRDLNMVAMEAFLDELSERIKDIEKKLEDGSYKPFIETFGPLKAGALGAPRSLEQAVVDRLDRIEARLQRTAPAQGNFPASVADAIVLASLEHGGRPVSNIEVVEDVPANVLNAIQSLSRVEKAYFEAGGLTGMQLRLVLAYGTDGEAARKIMDDARAILAKAGIFH